MDVQFYGANCLSFSIKGTRIVVDDNLASLGLKTITKPEDVALFTGPGTEADNKSRIIFSSPGEYEVSEVSITGIAARNHMEPDDKKMNATMFKLTYADQSVLITGHIYPDLSEGQLERIGIVDLLIVPVGGNGYTIDPVGALKLIKAIEPKTVIPTHYSDESINFEVPQQDLANALKEMAMELKESVNKFKLKSSELSGTTQLVVLEKS
jgi:L-ascorbate metabolism protein UlaG (beta-lactamase superfamily)